MSDFRPEPLPIVPSYYLWLWLCATSQIRIRASAGFG